ncbi:MAG: hypothetical protein AAFQ90_09575 [Pseudomonadota bacterium]
MADTDIEMTTLIARALYIRRRGLEEDIAGAALAVLRTNTMTGVHDDDLALDEARGALNEIMALTVADMPPPTDLTHVLIETIVQRPDLPPATQAQVWQEIGINPHRGRGYMSRQAHALDWPIWYALREKALST